MALPASGPTDCSSGFSQRIFNNLRYDNPWQAGATVAVGALCCPTVPNGFGYRASSITTGITGGGEPTWPLILTNTVVDGGVTWTAQDVANPSGKNHAPLVQFGYAMSSTEQDYFRLMAYEMAKAVSDELAADFSAAGYYRTATQTIGTGSFTIINFDTQEYDTDSAVTTGASWKYTVPTGKGGIYHVSASTNLTPAATGQSILAVYVNGSEKRRGVHLQQSGALLFLGPHVSADVKVNAGDTIDVRLFQDSGGNQTTEASASCTWVTIHRVFGS
jgi:hypothetical protein